jgi:hypothetical protein
VRGREKKKKGKKKKEKKEGKNTEKKKKKKAIFFEIAFERTMVPKAPPPRITLPLRASNRQAHGCRASAPCIALAAAVLTLTLAPAVHALTAVPTASPAVRIDGSGTLQFSATLDATGRVYVAVVTPQSLANLAAAGSAAVGSGSRAVSSGSRAVSSGSRMGLSNYINSNIAGLPRSVDAAGRSDPVLLEDGAASAVGAIVVEAVRAGGDGGDGGGGGGGGGSGSSDPVLVSLPFPATGQVGYHAVVQVSASTPGIPVTTINGTFVPWVWNASVANASSLSAWLPPREVVDGPDAVRVYGTTSLCTQQPATYDSAGIIGGKSAALVEDDDAHVGIVR